MAVYKNTLGFGLFVGQRQFLAILAFYKLNDKSIYQEIIGRIIDNEINCHLYMFDGWMSFVELGESW